MSFEKHLNTTAGRFAGIKRDYTLDQVKALSGSSVLNTALPVKPPKKCGPFFTAKTMSTPSER